MASQTGQRMSSGEREYARALFEAAEEAGQVAEVADEVGQLASLFDEQADLRELLGSHLISAGQKGETVERLFKGRVCDLMYRFLQVVGEKGRLAWLGGICRAFIAMASERGNRVEAEACVAQEMSPEQVSQLAKRLGESIGREVVLHQSVQPGLIGGVRLHIGDRVLDGSVAAQLRAMREKLREAGRVNAAKALAG